MRTEDGYSLVRSRIKTRKLSLCQGKMVQTSYSMINKNARLGFLVFGVVMGQFSVAASKVPVTPVRFKPGASSIVYNGKMTRAIGAHVYTYAAKKGSHLKIDLATTSGMNNLVVMFHIEFPSGKAFGQKGYDPFNGKLTETGTYKIVVDVNQMASNSDHGAYRLSLKRY